MKSFCIPDIFNTKIVHQLFDYKITFVNSQHENTNLNLVILYSKIGLDIRFKDFISSIQK